MWAASKRALDRLNPVCTRIGQTPPVTLEGARALAATIVLDNPDLLRDQRYPSDKLIKTLLRGLLGEHRS